MPDQVENIVQNLLADIQTQVNSRIESAVNEQIRNTLNAYDFEGKINLLTSLKLDNKLSKFEIRPIDIEARINAAAASVINDVTTQAKKQISSDIAIKINTIDFNSSVVNAVAQQVEARLSAITFPDNSINFSAIKQEGLQISGDKIVGGIIKNFSSTGIDDRTNNVAVTILDEHTVFENNLIAPSASIKGTLVVDGDLVLKGALPTDSLAFQNIVRDSTASVLQSLDLELFTNYSDVIFTKLKEDGLDLAKITVNGETIVDGNKIGSKITESNLQRVGVLRELQTQGETLLNQSLFVGNKRVGVNTIDPSHALSVWDQEVEVIVAKKQQNSAVLGTVRNQELVLSSNSKDNLICNPDGSVSIAKLVIGNIPMHSTFTTPTDDQPRGVIVWNSDPKIGDPIGWVSLGAARWARFGIIEP